jgi:hypothetical protein
MTSREQRRFRMRASLGEQLGDEVAEDLMDSLPPFDWMQIATKDDIRRLEIRFDGIDHRFEANDRRFDSIDQQLVSINQQLDANDRRFDGTDQQFEVMERRFDLVDQRFDLLETKLGTRMLRMSIASTVSSVGVLSGVLALLR